MSSIPAGPPAAEVPPKPFFRSLSRRTRFTYQRKRYEAPVFEHRERSPSSPFLRTWLRSLRWNLATLQLLFWLLIDFVRGRRSARDRGRRMREMFERIGGTAIKIGQQLSVRIDLLPFEICDELSKLQDSGPPFDVRYAIGRIEETTGRKLEEIFRVFDPVPIGSASIACVFQAYLVSGEKVAVKVRRPGIVDKFTTDLRFLDWVTYVPEILALVKWGFFRYLREEVRQMLLEELDFDREARYQRLFRQEAKRSKLWWLSAPRVFTEYCSADVMVSEFVQGVWCRELIAAVEGDDKEALDYIRSLNISPKKVAWRLLYTQFWSCYEGLFFHADPHPSNIVVQQDGILMFLDFGSCGTTSRQLGRGQQEVLSSMARNDVDGMVEAAVHLLEPLPPIDVHEFKRKIHNTYQRLIFAIRDKKSAWWERTSMTLWLAMVQVTKQFKLPINIDVIRQFRCSILYDTLAYRINPELRLVWIFRRWRREATLRKARRALRQRAKVTRREQRDRTVERLGESRLGLDRALWEVDNAVQDLPIRFQSAVNKGAYAAALMLRFLLWFGLLIVVLTVGLVGWHSARHEAIRETLGIFIRDHVLEQPVVLVLLSLVGIILLRLIVLRMTEQDSQTHRRVRPYG